MTRAWFPFPADEWQALIASMVLPLSQSVAAADLEWFDNEVRRGTKTKRLGRVALRKRWGWTDREVRGLLAGRTTSVPEAYHPRTTSVPPPYQIPAAEPSPAIKSVPPVYHSRTTAVPPPYHERPHARMEEVKKETTEEVNKGDSSRGSPPVRKNDPAAVTRAAAATGTAPSEVLAMANKVAEYICDHKIGREDGDAVIDAWEGLGYPPLADFQREALCIARACKESMHERFANDVRGDDWPEKADASGSVRSVLRTNSKSGATWSERLHLADAHAEEMDGRSRPKPKPVEQCAPVDDAPPGLIVPAPATEQPMRLVALSITEWQVGRRELHDAFGEDFDIWFGPVRLGGVSGGLVVLEVADRGCAAWLSDVDWLPAIEAALGARVAFRCVA